MKGACSRCLALALGSAISVATEPSAAVHVSVTNLVTDDATAHAAQITDPGLINAWGISFSSTSPFWVSSSGAGTWTIYRVDPSTQATTKVGLTVSIPGAGNPTGQVFSGVAGHFNGNSFLFVSEDGTVSGWRGALGTNAETLASTSAIYKGAAFGSIAGNSYLYAADFHGGAVSVFKGSAAAPALTGSFVDPSLPAGFAPFNVQALEGSLYVSYAEQTPGSGDETAGPGLGYVDRYEGRQWRPAQRALGHGHRSRFVRRLGRCTARGQFRRRTHQRVRRHHACISRPGEWGRRDAAFHRWPLGPECRQRRWGRQHPRAVLLRRPRR